MRDGVGHMRSVTGTALAQPRAGRVQSRATIPESWLDDTLTFWLGKDSMRSLPLKAAGIFIVAAAWACGGDGGGTGPGAPTAAFNAPSCSVGAACQFTDASTPAAEITARSWDFGDP